MDQNFKNASLQNYNLNAQYQLSNTAAVEVGYVGSLGRHLLTVLDINQPPPSALGTNATRAGQKRCGLIIRSTRNSRPSTRWRASRIPITTE